MNLEIFARVNMNYKTNQLILADKKTQLFPWRKEIRTQKLVYFSHVMQMDDELEKTIILDKVEDNRKREREQ